MLMSSLLFAASVSGVQIASAGAESDYVREIESWRAARVERLKRPDGWLSLVGLEWIKPGDTTLGSAKDNDIVLARAPAHLGTIHWEGDKVSIELKPGTGATIDGKLATKAELLDDSQPQPTVVAYDSVIFYRIDRDDRKGIRIKDSQAETRTGFVGIDYFPIDPSWRVVAEWQAFDKPQTLEIPTVLGTVDKLPVPGKAVFEREGKRYELLPVFETDDAKELFFIFADRTSGRETYGAGRFIYADLPKDGKVVIDFNKAYNPPCVFTPFATCPMAPPENRLDVGVTAGEKKYRGGHPH